MKCVKGYNMASTINIVCILCFLSSVFKVTDGQAEPLRIVCYYTNWAQYRLGRGRFGPSDINATMCTHVVYAHAGVNNNFTIKATEWNDLPSAIATGMYPQIIALKNDNPQLKTLLSVGGYTLSPSFTQIVQTKGTRTVFIESVIKYLRDWGFDGLDIMWEYPTRRGSTPGDREKFTNLLQDLRQAFTEESEDTKYEPLILSTSVATAKDIIDDAYEIGEIVKEVDFLNLLTYDFHGHWESWTGHSAPLYGRGDEIGSYSYNNVNMSVNYWIDNGTPSKMINVGVSPHARSYTIDINNGSLPGGPALGPGRPGGISQEPGGLTLYEVCNVAKDSDIFWDEIQMVPYMVFGNQWISYENKRSILEKLAFIKNNNIGGVMLWNMPSDDFINWCGAGSFPMLTTLFEELQQQFILPR